jgi:hypothetical protein
MKTRISLLIDRVQSAAAIDVRRRWNEAPMFWANRKVFHYPRDIPFLFKPVADRFAQMDSPIGWNDSRPSISALSAFRILADVMTSTLIAGSAK